MHARHDGPLSPPLPLPLPTPLNPPLLLTRLTFLMQDSDEGVALESCEFWTAFCEAQVEAAVLRPFLGRLVPVLLKNMVYDEYDEEVQDAEAAEDADHADDTDQEIKPFISR